MRHLLLAASFIALVGCTSSVQFNRVMEKPAAAAKGAAEVARGADQDLIRALALGVYKADGAADFPIVLCWPRKGPDVAGANLMTFADALQTVNKVAEKPQDTSYAAYIRRFGELEKAGNRDVKAERAAALKEIQAARERCELLAVQDAQGRLVDVSDVGVALTVPPIVGQILALDQLIKALVAQTEKAARAAVVREVIRNLLPQLREAVGELAKEPGPTFGPRVVYPTGTSKDAETMNRTVLGATITIRRWFVGTQARAQWAALEGCRKGAPSTGCLGRHSEVALADSLVGNAYAYRALAQNDSQKLLDQLSKATDGAEAATKEGSLADMIDALIGIGDALSGISDKYEAYRKTRE